MKLPALPLFSPHAPSPISHRAVLLQAEHALTFMAHIWPDPIISPLFHLSTPSWASAGTHTAFAMQEMGLLSSYSPKPAQDGFLRSCKVCAPHCQPCCHTENAATITCPISPCF